MVSFIVYADGEKVDNVALVSVVVMRADGGVLDFFLRFMNAAACCLEMIVF